MKKQVLFIFILTLMFIIGISGTCFAAYYTIPSTTYNNWLSYSDSLTTSQVTTFFNERVNWACSTYGLNSSDYNYFIIMNRPRLC